eukprot:GHRR01018357.1.p1 GENE.GHRR01018357.1~~GHRR01018357.1.p1  ORF type:complete len:342 (+),score=143.17 GHRR01018357.1:1083-2108(+)
MAAKEDLMEVFGTTDEQKICLEILAKGELQVSDKERQAQQENFFRDIAGVLVDKTINPETSRPYTLTMLERALRDVHFNPDHKKSAKQQALEVLPLLQQRFPIQRARMRLKLQVPAANQQDLLDMLDQAGSTVETIDAAGSHSVVITQVEPGVFRELHHFMHDTTARQGRIEVLSFAITAEGAADDFNILTPPAATAKQLAATTISSSNEAGSELAAAAAGMASASGRTAASAGAAAASQVQHRRQQRQQHGIDNTNEADISTSGQVLYVRGPIAGLPDEYASRKERFAELDQLHPGWQVELRSRGETADALFYSPEGVKVGTFAAARRQALAAHKAALDL